MNNSNKPTKWYDKTWLVAVLCVFLFPVGLYALWKNGFISIGWKIGVTVLIAVVILGQIGRQNQDDDTSTVNLRQASDVGVKENARASKNIEVGETLHTRYFDITVNQVSIVDEVNTGNQFADLKAVQGNLYLVINASFKNTDQESRMLMDGSVWINYNGKDYEFDKSETIMLEGWGIIFDQINPLTVKTTNLVYKISSEVKGDAYWQPGRAKKDQRILLGNIK